MCHIKSQSSQNSQDVVRHVEVSPCSLFITEDELRLPNIVEHTQRESTFCLPYEALSELSHYCMA